MPRNTAREPRRTRMVPSEAEFDVTDEAVVASLLGAHAGASHCHGRPTESSQQDAPVYYASFGLLRTRRS